MVVRALGL